MNRDEIIARLLENIDKVVRVTFTEDANNPLTPLRYSTDQTIEDETSRTGVRDMTILSVNDEGFVNQVRGEFFWSIFGDVETVEPLGDLHRGA